MSAHAVLRRLKALGFQVERVADSVRLRGPVATLTPDALATIRRHKSLLLVALSCPVCGRALDARGDEVWWGDRRVHHACGLAAWRKEWRR